MTTEQLVQLKAMSYDERVAKYKPLRNAGRVSLREYAYIIYSIPYSQALEETGEACADTGQSGYGDTHRIAGVLYTAEEKNGGGREHVDESLGQESFITALERDDKSVLPGRTDGSGLGEADTHNDFIPGDSQKTISPFYGG